MGPWAVVLGGWLWLAQTADSPVDRAALLLRRGQTQEALSLLETHLRAHPRDARAWSLNARGSFILGKIPQAAQAAQQVVQLRPQDPDAADLWGSMLFCQGRVREALREFDRAVALDPPRRARHWQRGIACYYLGRWNEGARQFKLYTQVDAADVENALWHFICVARARGLRQAQKQMLSLGGRDPRVPLMELYRLYGSKATVQEVLGHMKQYLARANLASQQRTRCRFYGHLYLGIYYEVHGKFPLAREHLQKAVGCAREHCPRYMWHVAQVHLWWLQGKLAGIPAPTKGAAP